MIGLGIGINYSRVLASIDTPRTAAFLVATGITDATIISALNTMDLALISAGLLPSGTGAGKIKALYPVVGGTATTHKYNFVNPLDIDAAFRLSFSGGWTHDSSGAKPNGINAYADTFLIQDTHLSLNSASLGACYNENVASSATKEGAQSVGFIGCFPYLGTSYIGYVSTNIDSTASAPNSLGIRATSRINSTQTILLVNSTISVVANNSISNALVSFYFGARNLIGSGSSYNGTKRNFMFLGDGLTTTELTNLSSIITAFNTSLSR